MFVFMKEDIVEISITFERVLMDSFNESGVKVPVSLRKQYDLSTFNTTRDEAMKQILEALKGEVSRVINHGKQGGKKLFNEI